MSEIVISNIPGPRVIAYGRGPDKARITLQPGSPVELTDEQVRAIERHPAAKAQLDACARRRVPSEADTKAQARAEAADKRAAQARAQATSQPPADPQVGGAS